MKRLEIVFGDGIFLQKGVENSTKTMAHSFGHTFVSTLADR